MFSGRLLKSKIEVCALNAGLYMAYEHRFSFTTVLRQKRWYQSIQNHAKNRFQAFARRHLKLLCWLVGI